MRAVGIALVLGIVVIAPSASAQIIPCEEGPCIRQKRKGTHFIAEINGGATLAGNGGFDVGGLVGVGGKLRGFPPRFYLVGEFAFSTYGNSGTVSGIPKHYHEGNRYRDMALGLRVYIPIFGPFRLFADLLGGATHASGTLERTGLTTLMASGWSPLGLVGLGVQFRLFHHLSLGLRGKIVFSDDGMQALHDFVATDPIIRTSLSAGLTWHF
jgi:hypothetical protein